MLKVIFNQSMVDFDMINMKYNHRWDRGAGETISSQTKTFWETNEPNVVEFDYSIRATSPLAKAEAAACGTNPTSACSIESAFSCVSANSDTTIVNPSNQINGITLGDTAIGTDSCSQGANQCKATGIFLSFDLVRATTADASPACMAMYGPDITDAAKSGETNTCDLLFKNHDTDSLLAKWTDLKCNQRTRSQICNLGNKRLCQLKFE